MQLGELCDICGQEVVAEEAYRGDMMASELMCPTPMTLHQTCFQKASGMWQLDDSDASCAYDPDYPETALFTVIPGSDSPS